MSTYKTRRLALIRSRDKAARAAGFTPGTKEAEDFHARKFDEMVMRLKHRAAALTAEYGPVRR